MVQEIGTLIYYLAFLMMTAWALSMYSNKLLNESRLNPIPEDMMKRDTQTEENEGENDSDENINEYSSDANNEIESVEAEWGGEESVEGSHAHKRPDPIAVARFHGEHED